RGPSPEKEKQMKHRRLIAAGTFAALTIGGLSAGSIASAQSYGGDDTADQTSGAQAFETENDLVQVQDEGEENPDTAERGRRGHRGGCNLEEAAAAIGIDEAELREALDGGQSIAEVAEANGVAVDDVIDSMVAAQTERIEEKVAEGRLTQEEADEKLAELETRTTDRVNGVDDDRDSRDEAPEADDDGAEEEPNEGS
ncbi:MAG: hypothetical protein KDA98_10940, partial [Acidimicrobiales bacterium]|nr:hypothetical protein [Acidimicrobiales bacterium]